LGWWLGGRLNLGAQGGGKAWYRDGRLGMSELTRNRGSCCGGAMGGFGKVNWEIKESVREGERSRGSLRQMARNNSAGTFGRGEKKTEVALPTSLGWGGKDTVFAGIPLRPHQKDPGEGVKTGTDSTLRKKEVGNREKVGEIRLSREQRRKRLTISRRGRVSARG